jgi:hypothetical protein
MDPDQIARMRRLVWIHAGRKPIMLVLSWRGSNIFANLEASSFWYRQGRAGRFGSLLEAKSLLLLVSAGLDPLWTDRFKANCCIKPPYHPKYHKQHLRTELNIYHNHDTIHLQIYIYTDNVLISSLLAATKFTGATSADENQPTNTIVPSEHGPHSS